MNSVIKMQLDNMKFTEFIRMKSSITEGANDNLENYMFFGNLKTIKNRVEEMILMDPTTIDSILKNGHSWAVDHIATSKDDIEEVANFLENEVKETGSGKIPESTTNEAMVQIAGKGKPAGAMVLAKVILEFLSKEKHLTPAADRQLIGLEDDIAQIIMDSTF